MKLNDWFQEVDTLPVDGAEQYRIGQRISKAQADEIMRMVAKSVDFDIDKLEERNGNFELECPYNDFCTSYWVLLSTSGPVDENGWRSSLWEALPNTDRYTMMIYVRQRFGVNLQAFCCELEEYGE